MDANEIPELPNIITMLYHKFQNTAWVAFLHEWENVVYSLFIAIVISFICYLGVRRKSTIPSGLQNFLELFIEGMRSVVVGIIGPEGDKFVPFLGTLFIYILSMNLFGLIPLMKSPSSSLNITIAQAIAVFILVQYLSIKHMGLLGFLYHLAGAPKDILGWLLVPIMFPVELLTQLSRPITLAFRLFGNIFGEDFMLGYFALLGAGILPFLGYIGIPFQLPFVFLALLTGTIQALVFTLLTTIYILLSIQHGEESYPT